MAVSYIASASIISVNNTDQTTVVCNKPTGTADGDIMVAVFTAPYTGALTYTAPSGWTLLASHNGGGSVSLWSGAYYKIASSEPSNYTWQCSAAGSLMVGTATYRAANNGYNLYYASNQGTNGTITQPSLTPSGGEPFLAAHAVSWHDTGGSSSSCSSSAGLEKWDSRTTDGSPSTHERGSAFYLNSSTTSGGGTDSGATMAVSPTQTSYVAWTFGVSEQTNGPIGSTMGGFTSSFAATEQVAVYRSTATATSPAGTNVSSLTINKPSGTVDDDYMVAVISTNTTTTTAPSGWTLLEGPTNDGSGLSTYLYQKKAASEGSSYTWNFAASGGKTGSISSFSNSTGVNTWLSKITHTTDPAAGDALTPTGPAIRYDVFAWREQADATVTWDTGTETHDIVTNNSSGVRVGQSGTYQQTSIAGGGTIPAATADPTGTLTFSVMWSIAIGSKVTATGTIGSTLGGFSSSLAGNVGGGTLSASLGGFTSSLSGTELTGGPLGSTMGGFTSSLAGQRLVTGPLGSTMGGFTSSFAGNLKGVKIELLIGDDWTDVSEHVRYDSAVSLTCGRTAEGTTMTTTIASFTLDNRTDTVQNRYSLRNVNGIYHGLIGRNTKVRINDLEFGYRFHGEVSSWAPGADSTNNDQYVELECSGIVRRLSAGSPPTWSAMKREVMGNSPLAYWPCDEDDGATSFSSPMVGVPNLSISGGTPDFGDYTALRAAGQMPQVNASEWRSPVVQGTSMTNGVTVAFLLASPGGITNGTQLMNISFYVDGSSDGSFGSFVQLQYTATNTLKLSMPMVFGAPSVSGTVPVVGNTGVLVYVSIDHDNATNDGNIALWYQREADTSPVLVGTDTWAMDGTLSEQVALDFNGANVDLSSNSAAYMGQIAVWDGYGPSNTLEYASVGAYAGEKAGTRFARLCTEESITHTVNNASNSSAMGAQLAKTTLDLLRECEATDMGIMYELRDDFGLGYVVRRDLYNQDVTLELDYSASDLSSQLRPVFDDKDLTNDVIVQRVNGSQARYQVTSGALSTQDPPNGVGSYASSVSVSLWLDDQCYAQAGWRAHLGTVDEERITSLGVALENPRFAASSTLRHSAMDVMPGSRITVSNAPDWTTDVDQIVQGYSERFDQFTHDITYNTSSAAPYITAVAVTTPSTTTAKADSLTSTLHADIDDSATSLVVDVTGVTWRSQGIPIALFDSCDTIDVSKWTIDGGSGLTANGQWTFATTLGGSYTTATSATTYDLTGKYHSLQLVSAGNQALASLEVFACQLYKDSNNSVSFYINDGHIFALHRASGSTTISGSTTYNSTTHQWLRIREQSGTTYWDTSPDGITWTNFYSISNPFAVTALEAMPSVGTYDTEASTTTVVMDNIDLSSRPFDIIVGGERMTVTAVSGTSSPQTFTVTRAVNGITKSHTAGAQIRLWQPAIVGL